VAPFTGFVSKVLAEPFDLTTSCATVTLGTIFQSFLMGFVVKLNTFFELHHVTGTSGSSKCYDCNQGYDGSFHCFSPMD
jgi:hypothetical protein